MRKLWPILGSFLMLFSVQKAHSQEKVFTEEIFSPGFQLGAGARAVSMGGAYVSLGGDYSSSFWNPATLADIRRNEIFGTFTHLMRGSSTAANTFDSGAFETDASYTKLNEFGMAYAVPTVRGSLVFSFGFNRLKSFDSNFGFEWFNPDTLVNQAWRENFRGSLNAWILAGAVDVSPNMSVGLGLNFWTGGQDFGSAFREVDIDNVYNIVPEDFEQYTEQRDLNTDISGFNVKLGSVLKFGQTMRLGLAVSSPMKLKVEEDWSEFYELRYDDGFVGDTTIAGIFEYRIQSPWTFSAGASLNLLNFVFAGDVEYNDWTQVQYNSEPPIDGTTQNDANAAIQNFYRPTTRIRLGAEFTLPLTGLSFRAGYFLDPSVWQDARPEEDKEFYSAGIGFLLDKQVKLDLGLVHGRWKRFDSNLTGTDDLGPYVEDIKTYEGFVTLAFRF